MLPAAAAAGVRLAVRLLCVVGGVCCVCEVCVVSGVVDKAPGTGTSGYEVTVCKEES